MPSTLKIPFPLQLQTPKHVVFNRLSWMRFKNSFRTSNALLRKQDSSVAINGVLRKMDVHRLNQQSFYIIIKSRIF